MRRTWQHGGWRGLLVVVLACWCTAVAVAEQTHTHDPWTPAPDAPRVDEPETVGGVPVLCLGCRSSRDRAGVATPDIDTAPPDVSDDPCVVRLSRLPDDPRILDLASRGPPALLPIRFV